MPTAQEIHSLDPAECASGIVPQSPLPVHHHNNHRRSCHSRGSRCEGAQHDYGLHKPSVCSTAGGRCYSDASVDLEKQANEEYAQGEQGGWSQPSSLRGSRLGSHIQTRHDSFYQIGHRASHSLSQKHQSRQSHQLVRHIDDDGLVTTEKVTYDPSQTLKLLLYFSLLLVPSSFALAIWTLVATACTLIVHPFRLILIRDRSLTQLIRAVLEPALTFHLERVGASCDTAAADAVDQNMLRLPHAIMVLVASAPLSLAFMIWALVLGVFWVFAAVIGDPDGLDGRSDGRDLIETTRRRWERWLGLSMRSDQQMS